MPSHFFEPMHNKLRDGCCSFMLMCFMLPWLLQRRIHGYSPHDGGGVRLVEPHLHPIIG
jgi:hypothetical protein